MAYIETKVDISLQDLNDCLLLALGFFSRSPEAAETYDLYLHANDRHPCPTCRPDLTQEQLKIENDLEMIHPLKNSNLSPTLRRKFLKIQKKRMLEIRI